MKDDQNYYVIESKIDNEDAIHAIDLFENDDAFLEFMGARTKYLIKHEKGTHNHYPNMHAYFDESMDDKIEGLGELTFSTPSESEMT